MAAVDDALVAFSGTRARAGSRRSCDERLWAAICWRVGISRFLDAIDACRAEMDLVSSHLAGSARVRYFQAYLNRRFPKGGAK